MVCSRKVGFGIPFCWCLGSDVSVDFGNGLGCLFHFRLGLGGRPNNIPFSRCVSGAS